MTRCVYYLVRNNLTFCHPYFSYILSALAMPSLSLITCYRGIVQHLRRESFGKCCCHCITRCDKRWETGREVWDYRCLLHSCVFFVGFLRVSTFFQICSTGRGAERTPSEGSAAISWPYKGSTRSRFVQCRRAQQQSLVPGDRLRYMPEAKRERDSCKAYTRFHHSVNSSSVYKVWHWVRNFVRPITNILSDSSTYSFQSRRAQRRLKGLAGCFGAWSA